MLLAIRASLPRCRDQRSRAWKSHRCCLSKSGSTRRCQKNLKKNQKPTHQKRGAEEGTKPVLPTSLGKSQKATHEGESLMCADHRWAAPLLTSRSARSRTKEMVFPRSVSLVSNKMRTWLRKTVPSSRAAYVNSWISNKGQSQNTTFLGRQASRAFSYA